MHLFKANYQKKNFNFFLLKKKKKSIYTIINMDLQSSENQARILKNLLQEVCLHFKIIPEGCIL